MENNKTISRRQFLLRTVKAGAVITASGAAGYLMLDKNGPSGQPKASNIILPDFSVPTIEGQTMSIVSGANRSETLKKAVDLLGGIGRFVKPGELVLIKPNVAFARAALLGATTNPESVAAIVELCYKAGAKEVIVTDNPINDAQSCFTLTGIAKAAQSKGATIMLPKESYFKPLSLEQGKLIKNWPVLISPLEGVNKVIGIVPVKDHSRSGASMSMKGWYGLLGGRRNVFHQDINTIIAELAILIKPTLVILDATEVMMTNGPTGGSVTDLRKTNMMIASCDQVAADSFGASLLDLTPQQLRYLSMAQEAGAGTTDYEKLKPLRASIG